MPTEQIYVYQKIQDAIKEAMQDRPIRDRLSAAFVQISCLDLSYYRDSVPKELMEAIKKVQRFKLDDNTNPEEAIRLLWELMVTAMLRRKS